MVSKWFILELWKGDLGNLKLRVFGRVTVVKRN